MRLMDLIDVCVTAYALFAMGCLLVIGHARNNWSTIATGYFLGVLFSGLLGFDIWVLLSN